MSAPRRRFIASCPTSRLEGIAVILIGDDAEEVMAMADRIIVFRAGRIAAEMKRGSFDREAILLAAAHAAQDHDSTRAA